MLTELYIRDFAIVDRLELSFTDGLSVLTGETGAGKSILIDALALALGERADSGVIRHGCARADISAHFAVPNGPAAAWLVAQDLTDDDGCVLRRVVERDKSKAYINGRPVPVQMQRELGLLLVDIHGQHEHQSLLKRETQRALLDGYGDAQTAAAEVASHYRTWQERAQRCAALSAAAADREARVDLLRYQVQELQTLGLEANEWPGLEEEHARLAHGAELITGVQALADALCDAEDVNARRLLAQAQSKLDALGAYDTRLGELSALLNEALIRIDDVGAQLRHYGDTLDLDPQRLQWVEQRLSAGHELARKHRVAPTELPGLLTKLQTELNDIDGYEQNLAALQAEIAAAEVAYHAAARTLSKRRAQAAKRLGVAVTEQIHRMGMPGGAFGVELHPCAPSAFGLEQIEFTVTANPGQPAKALNKVASGGELSRISLALQVITAGLASVPTLIFDEVDVGIGGAVAEIVGQQLRALSAKRQVLCITHLGQVAAQGDQHYQVSKQTQAENTVAQISSLDKKARVQEIARMIGGVQISQQTLALAKDMLTRVRA